MLQFFNGLEVKDKIPYPIIMGELTNTTPKLPYSVECMCPVVVPMLLWVV